MANGDGKRDIPWAGLITSTLSGLSAVLVAYNTWQVSSFDAQLKQAESDRNLNFRIYGSVTDALESNDARRIQAVKTIVDAMTPEPLKTGFLEVLTAGENTIWQVDEAEAVTRTAARSGLSSADLVAGDGSGGWGEWDFDLFWCSASGLVAQTQAENLQNALLADGARGRVRVRILPESRRVEAGNAAWGYEVRGEAGEEDISQALVDLARRTVSPEFQFVPIEQQNPTRWYVSAFLCPEPQDP